MKTINQETIADAAYKLDNRLEEQMPGCKPLVYDFGRYLSSKLTSKVIENSELNSGGFCMIVEKSLVELQYGYARTNYSDLPVKIKNLWSSLVGYPEAVYNALRLYVVDMAKVAFPADFAEEVEQLYAEANAEMAKNKTYANVFS